MNAPVRKRAKMVYAMTNDTKNNQVIAFARSSSGKITSVKAYSTGGSGTGPTPAAPVDPLSSQGSLILSGDGYSLFAVNAGSNSISKFYVSSNGTLTRVDVQKSGGIKPNSLALYGNLLYVSNAGDPATGNASNVTGFWVEGNGHLIPVVNATYSLSTPDAQPACIVFNHDGTLLAVSELNTNRLTVFQVNGDGTLSGPVVNDSNGKGPFGSVFLSRGPLLVSEAGVNALSSYSPSSTGELKVISGSIPNGQLATCWVVVSRNEHYAYTANAGTGNISIYHIDDSANLHFIKNINSTRFGATVKPIDMGASMDGKNLYVLNGNKGWISVFTIGHNGRLSRIQVLKTTGLPELGSQGLAVQ